MLFTLAVLYLTGFLSVGAITASILSSQNALDRTTVKLSLRNSVFWPYWALRFLLTLKCGIKEGILSYLRRTRLKVMLSKETDDDRFEVAIETGQKNMKNCFQLFMCIYCEKYGRPSPEDYEILKSYFINKVSQDITSVDSRIDENITKLLTPKK